MQEIRTIGLVAVIFMTSSLLVSCQMSANSPALSGEPLPPPEPLQARPQGPAGHAESDHGLPPPTPPGAKATSASPSGRAKAGALTIEAAVHRAVGWHPAIDEASGRIAQSDAMIRAAEAGYYPKINAGMDTGYRSNDRNGWRPKFNVTASQLLYDFGKVSSAVEGERAGEKLSHARLLLTIDNLARDTSSAVIEVQRFRILEQLSREQVEGVKSIAALVQERSDKGASTMSDKVQADARVEAALATQWQYQSELDRWKVALATLLGVTDADPAPDIPAWLARSCDAAAPDWADVPAMLEARARKEEAEARLAASKADAYPTVSLEASTGYDLNSGRGHRWRRHDQPDYAVGLNVSSNLYNGGQTGAKQRAAFHALQSADAAIRAARYETERSLLEARSQVGTLGRLTASLSQRVGMMAKTRDLYREQYVQLGTRTLLDLLNAERELYESRFQIANTSHDLRRLSINCLYSSGRMRHGFGLDLSTLRGGALPR